jgi:hypothetical protein
MKNKLNFVIDAVMLLVMAAIAGVGFLMNWVLLPGRETVERYGRRVELGFLGLDRHQWGDVHLVLGIALLALLVLHIVLHWKQVLHLYRRLIPDRAVRIVVAVVFLAVTVCLLGFALAARPVVQPDEGGRRRGRASTALHPHAPRTSRRSRFPEEPPHPFPLP